MRITESNMTSHDVRTHHRKHDDMKEPMKINKQMKDPIWKTVVRFYISRQRYDVYRLYKCDISIRTVAIDQKP